MWAVITGGSGSGKSAFAEDLAMDFCPGTKYYIATMTFRDEETRQRIEKHRRMRAGKKFATIEKGYALEEISLEDKTSCILLECVSNLTANEMYDPGAKNRHSAEEEIVEYMMCGIRHLLTQAKDLVVVTNEVFGESESDPETERYRRILGRLNQKMAAEADGIAEIVFGIPVWLKPLPLSV